MLSKSLVFCCFMVYVTAAPPTDVVPLEKQQPTVIPIVSQSEELESNGTYKFSYETGNGIKREESSYSKIVPHAQGRSAGSNEGGESDESDEIHVQRGSYSYTAPDGTVISVSYIADENGFQPIGTHIPQAISLAASANSSEKSGRALNVDDSVNAASAPVASRAGPGSEQSVNKNKSESINIAVPRSESDDATSSKGAQSSTSENTTVTETEITTKTGSDESNSGASTTSPSTEVDKLSTTVRESSSTVASESSTDIVVTTSAATSTEASSTPEATTAAEEATSPAA